MNNWPQVQVALDLTDIDSALRIASAATSAGIRWVEAGTPLIKSQGSKAITALKQKFSEAIIVADMKTLDAGAIEASIAFEAGADVMSVSGLAHQQTIRDAVLTGKRYSRRVIADLLMTSSSLKRAKLLERLGVDIVCAHTGIDAQKVRGHVRPAKSLSSLVGAVKIPVAVAGGVNPTIAAQLVSLGIKIIIVGGWITKSQDPLEASKKILESIHAQSC
ncbi:MAG TPA: orotidine 5'-phosphate decarboxylase / HUMPS family protein [Candidatus Bathyarchaeia archaeon]|nr:orotidine 5'-phosphate decarboxylase / HUMPS family protein [Candidatus Bathyarchaeia archaeon]